MCNDNFCKTLKEYTLNTLSQFLNKDTFKIALCEFAYNNSEIIKLLTNRGTAIDSLDHRKLDKANKDIIDRLDRPTDSKEDIFK